jgi:hypothetical protein
MQSVSITTKLLVKTNGQRNARGFKLHWSREQDNHILLVTHIFKSVKVMSVIMFPNVRD